MIALVLVAVIVVALAATSGVHVSLLPWWVVQLPVVLLIGEALAVAGLVAVIVITARARYGWPGPAVTP
jgi:hypothetical protein